MTDWLSTQDMPAGQMVDTDPRWDWAREWFQDLLLEMCGESGLTDDCPARKNAKGPHEAAL